MDEKNNIKFEEMNESVKCYVVWCPLSVTRIWTIEEAI